MTPLELLLFAIAGITLLELAAFAVIAFVGLSGLTVAGLGSIAVVGVEALLGLAALAGSTIVAGLIAAVHGLAHSIRLVSSRSRALTVRRGEVPLHG